ncbi:hypothetical protein FBQ87_07555 [Sphingobacteriales bacterium CHB3]|nr:hypothetical protein [Sphingobacteriales bacterium CHB3]
MPEFEILGEIDHIELIAAGKSIRDLKRLERMYGKGRWRKHKGSALVRLADNTIHYVEVHWYEAHGIGKKEIKIKRPL